MIRRLTALFALILFFSLSVIVFAQEESSDKEQFEIQVQLSIIDSTGKEYRAEVQTDPASTQTRKLLTILVPAIENIHETKISGTTNKRVVFDIGYASYTEKQYAEPGAFSFTVPGLPETFAASAEEEFDQDTTFKNTFDIKSIIEPLLFGFYGGIDIGRETSRIAIEEQRGEEFGEINLEGFPLFAPITAANRVVNEIVGELFTTKGSYSLRSADTFFAAETFNPFNLGIFAALFSVGGRGGLETGVEELRPEPGAPEEGNGEEDSSSDSSEENSSSEPSETGNGGSFEAPVCTEVCPLPTEPCEVKEFQLNEQLIRELIKAGEEFNKGENEGQQAAQNLLKGSSCAFGLQVVQKPSNISPPKNPGKFTICGEDVEVLPKVNFEKGVTGGKIKFADWLSTSYNAKDNSGSFEIDVCKLKEWLKKK